VISLSARWQLIIGASVSVTLLTLAVLVINHEPIGVSESRHNQQTPVAEPRAVPPTMPEKIESTSTAWVEIPATSALKKHPLSNLESTAFVRMSHYEPRQGEAISIFIPQENKAYAATVEKVILSASGNRTVSGSLQGSTLHKFTITTGRTNSFATFNTPTDSYQIEAANGIGLLVPTSSLRAKMDFTNGYAGLCFL
jgi:hypothetical protein